MKHLEIILLPILMFSDYFLTVWAAVLKEIKYDDYFKTEHYELNPIFQQQIRAKTWFSPRHILLTILLTSLVGVVVEFCHLPEYLIQGLFGCLFVLYGTIIGRHLSNILTFRYFARSTEHISGQITMAHSMALAISTYQYLVVALPITVLVVFSPTPFVVGGSVGILLLFRIHVAWIWKYKKQQAAQKK